jgi:YHS domain-containing protein
MEQHEPGLDPNQGQTALDPVCGMTVEIATARARNLQSTHNSVEYFFCGRGCKLDFEEHPEQYLRPGHRPSM